MKSASKVEAYEATLEAILSECDMASVMVYSSHDIELIMLRSVVTKIGLFAKNAIEAYQPQAAPLSDGAG